MGNTVTCCVSPDASPKLSRARGGGAAPGPDRWADAYQAAAAAGGGGGGSGSAEAESGDSDPGGGPHLQHISDREFPDGERRRRGASGGALRAGGRAAGSAGHRIPAPLAAVPVVLPPGSAAGGCSGGTGSTGRGASPPAARPLCPGVGSGRSGETRGGGRGKGAGGGVGLPAPGPAPRPKQSSPGLSPL